VRSFFSGISILVVFVSLSGCGDKPAYIADRLRFRVDFENEKIFMIYDLNKEYSLNLNESHAFEDLSLIKIKHDDNLSADLLITEVYANPSHLGEDWPGTSFSSLPNNKKLPSPLRSRFLKEWLVQRNSGARDSSFVYDQPDYINFGGSLNHPAIKDLPRAFYAYQNFLDSKGAYRGSLIILGPNDNFEGAMYFFGYLGLNPFVDRGQQLWRDLQAHNRPSSDLHTLEFSIAASSPVEIKANSTWDWLSYFEIFSAIKVKYFDSQSLKSERL